MSKLRRNDLCIFLAGLVIVWFLAMLGIAAFGATLSPRQATLAATAGKAMAKSATASIVIGGDTNGSFIYPVTLQWDASPDTNVTGYNTYMGVASRTYTNMFNAGAATNCRIYLDYGVRYSFAVTAYNMLGVESAYSVEVTYGCWGPDRVTISWPTNFPAALIVSATLSAPRSQWTVAVPTPNTGTFTSLIGTGSVFFALSGSTNRLYIRGWNPKNQ